MKIYLESCHHLYCNSAMNALHLYKRKEKSHETCKKINYFSRVNHHVALRRRRRRGLVTCTFFSWSLFSISFLFFLHSFSIFCVFFAFFIMKKVHNTQKWLIVLRKNTELTYYATNQHQHANVRNAFIA